MSETRVLLLQDCQVDLDANEVRLGDQTLALSTQEVGILETLMAANERTVTQQDLYKEVWGYRGAPVGRAATFAVFRLRKKLEKDPAHPAHLLTVRGKGFRLVGVQSHEGSLPLRPSPPTSDPVPDLVAVTGPLRSNLVEPESGFIGREESLDRIVHALSGKGVLTLVGPAGTGKTRLAQRVAAQELQGGAWPGGIWFCDLVECHTLQDVLRMVEGALGKTALSELEDADRSRALGEGLAQRARTLLVLDNCEQVLSPVAVLLGALSGSAPDCRFLTTSRESLRVPGEQVIRVQPLDAEEGIQLFLDRARLVRPGMSLTIEDRSILEDIVTELDGLPLALELAAGRARMMSLRQLRDRLDRRFDLLRGSPTERRSKEATLRGALDWSWDLLKPWEREVWMQCTIFRGGFSCEAAEAVLDLRAHPDAPWVVDVLEELLEKSLLVIDEDPHEPRFRQLVSVREYGQERLPQLPGAERDALRRRHAEHYSRLGAETALEALHRQGGVALRQVRLSDLDNILQASRWGVDNSVGPVAARATLAAMDLIAHRGPVALSESLVDGALSLDFMPFPLAARLHLARAGARQVAGRLDEALADAAVAIELAQNNGLSKLEGRAVGLQGRVHQRAGRIEDAARCFMKALRVHRMEGDRRAEAERLSQRGMLNLYREDLEEALSDLEEALAIQRSQGNRVAEGSTLGNMATLHNARGDKARAQQLVEEALSIACEVGNRRVEAVLMNNLGLLLSGQGRPARVEELYQSSIDLAEAIGDTQQQGLAMGNLANHHVMEGQAESALRCYLRGLELDRRAGNRRGECVTLGNLGDFYLGRKELGPAHESLVRSLEIAESLGYQTAQGAFGATLALVAALQGDRDEAERGIAQSIERLVAAGNPGELFKARCIAVRIQSLFGAGPKDLESARSVLRGELEAMGEGVSGELRQALELANQESTGA